MLYNRDAKPGEVAAQLARMSDFHAHLRQGPMLQAVAPQIMDHMRYVLVMPNTGPITTIEEALAYHSELRRIADECVPDRRIDFIPTLYFTDKLTPKIIERLAELRDEGLPFGVKYYPPEQGATTGSGIGMPLDDGIEVLRAMERNNIPLLGHFESVKDSAGNLIPPEMREGYMVREVLPRFRDRFRGLNICVEHASTREAVEFVKDDPSGKTVMTVTPQHSLFTSGDFSELGSELKCMPIVKTPEDRAALVEFITTGDWRAIAGADTAPHPHRTKEGPLETAANGCWLPHASELYASVFFAVGALDERFEKFASLNGPDWWGLPRPDPEDTVTLIRQDAPIPDPVAVGGEEDDVVVPLGWGVPGQHLQFVIK